MLLGIVQDLKPKLQEIQLTSFSILMARHKGFLETAVKGAAVFVSVYSVEPIAAFAVKVISDEDVSELDTSPSTVTVLPQSAQA